MEAVVRRLGRVGVAVMIGLPLALTALTVVGGVTGHPWLVVTVLAVSWGLVAAGPGLSRRERRGSRWLAGVGGVVGLALLVTSIVLGDPWLFIVITMVIVFFGLVSSVIDAVFTARGSDRPD